MHKVYTMMYEMMVVYDQQSPRRTAVSTDCQINHNALSSLIHIIHRIIHNCGNISLPLPGEKECAHPGAESVEEKVVEVRRLCDLMKDCGFTKVNKMKISAQGTDFVILKDVLENCPHVSFNEIKLECQVYEKTIPLYMTDNYCPRIEAYVRDKFPNVNIKWDLNVCWSG